MPPSPDPVVAVANLNPPSPTPVSIQPAIQNTVVPSLHGQAATADEAAPSSAVATEPSVPHHHSATMGSNPEPADASDTIVVGGDFSGESHDESDGSIDYGEGEERQAQETAEPDAAVDDYARTFDSPAAHEDQGEAEDAQPDVSMASESMNSPSAPDPAAVLSDHPSSPTPPLATPERAGGSESPSETPPSAAANASPSPKAPATASATEPAEQSSSTASAPDATPASADEDDAAVDIQKLVDDITARAAATDSPPPTAPAQAATPVTAAVTAQAAPAPLSVSLPPSLPPKPSLPNPPASLPAIPPAHYSFQPRGPNAPAAPAVSTTASPGAPPGSYSAHEGISSLPAPPPGGFGGPPHATHHMPLNGDASSGHYHGSSIKQLWDQFQADEKRYTSEAKWERFPEGSRIFIGNLSSERVSKREVFDVFHQFGRLAQISLKSAYGFVQYHTVAEGHAAMQNAQGIELGGRKIHLEISRAQKKKEERDRSPDRRGPRGGHGNDRFDNPAERGWRRDDYRPGRSPSPRRHEPRGSRDGPFPRDRDFGNHGRRRSRSPPRFNRHSEDSYRRRSPSPHRRAPSNGDQFDLPRRFGADVPDVQILLLQEVSRDFVGWVQGAFHNKGLKTDVMYLNPRFPRETVLQRQVAEGVHGIIDLDYGAQTKGKIPIQLFIRSGGSSVRFELYQDVDPPVAAELVMREKSQPPAHLAQPQQPSYPPANNTYNHHQPPAGYPYQQYPQQPQPHQQHPAAAPPPAAVPPDLASMVGNLDNTALHALLASLQAPQQPAAHAPAPTHSHIPPAAAAAAQNAAAAQQIDMNALLGNLRSVAGVQAHPQHQHQQQQHQVVGQGYDYSGGYGAGAGGYGNGGGGMDAATQQVQSIMEQLKRGGR